MKFYFFILSIIFFRITYVNTDAVCTEEMWINELKQDVLYNGKLDCLRVPLPPPSGHTETEEERKLRLEAVWDTDCSFEASYDWITPLKEKFGLKNGLVDKDGNPVERDFEEQADMCEIARALIAGGVLEGVTLENLNQNSFNDLSCPGNEGKIGICAVSGGAAPQAYSWYILLEGRGMRIGESPNWQMSVSSLEKAKNREYSS